MADDLDFSKMSDKELVAYIKSGSPELKSETPKMDERKPEEPKKLEGRAEFNEQMLANDAKQAKEIVPQKEDPALVSAAKYAMLPVRALNLGTGQAGEDLLNAGLGTVQAGLGVPTHNRMSMGDFARKLDPGFITPGEMQRAPALQQALNSTPAARPLFNIPNFAGAMLSPIGAGVGKLAGIPIKFARAAIPSAQLGSKVMQIAQNTKPAAFLSSLLQGRNALQGSGILQRAGQALQNPIAAGAASGAAYSPVFAGGARFGQNRTLPSVQETGQNAAFGGALGGAFGAGAGLLQKLAIQNRIAQLAKDSQMETPPKVHVGEKELVDLPDAKTMKANLQSQLYNTLAKETSPVQKDLEGKYFLARAKSQFGNEGEEHAQALAEANRDFNKARAGRQKSNESRQFQETKQAESRAYRESQQQEKTQLQDERRNESRQFQQGRVEEQRSYQQEQQQQRFERTGEHTGQSGNHYEGLASKIENAGSHDELAPIRHEIVNPGAGPEGKRLLDSRQQSELLKQWREKRYELNKSSGGEPGESEGGEQTPPVSEQPSQKSEQTGQVSEQSAIKSEQAPTNPVRTFLENAFRKTINKKNFGNRENRYQFAVSVDALSKAGGLDPYETTALKNWVSDLSEMRRELTYKNMQIQQLTKWAVENEEKWIGEQAEVSSRKTTDKKTGEDNYLVLENAAREGKFRRILLRAKMENDWEEATQQNHEHEKINLEQFAGKGEGLQVVRKPHVRTTTNGTAGDHQENANGSLELKGGIKKLKIKPLVEPKTADELFDRMEDLLEWQNHFRSKLTDVKNASAGGNGSKNYNYLDDGRTPAEVMGKAFENLKLPYLEGKAPNTHVWHVDDSGHVSTTEFVQETTRGSLADSRANLEARIDKFVEALPKNKNGEIDYDAFWGTPQRMNQLMSGFTGLEAAPILALMLGKQAHKLASQVGKATAIEAVFAGTIDDILRDSNHARFGADVISESLHNMLGEINDNFFSDKTGMYHPVKSAEDLVELLNQFKGEKVQRSTYRRVAQKQASEQAEKDGLEFDSDAKAEANRRADTALMIRQHYKNLAEKVQSKIDEMDIRRRDAKSGAASKEGKKFYTDADIDEEGRVRKSAYSGILHEGLQELHRGLTLQPSRYGNLGGFLDGALSRKGQSIMANNPRVAVRNFFDQAPLTIAQFGEHFFTAAADLNGRPDYSEALQRMPVIPQADMSNVRLEDSVADQRAPENAVEAIGKNVDKLNLFLSKNLDPIFKGKTPLVGLADKNYAKVTALASFYKQAKKMGIDRHDFMDALMNEGFTGAERKAIFAQTSKDLTQTLNSVAPGLNKDLFANSSLGRFTQQYSTPGRRNMKMLENWAKSGWDTKEGLGDKLRLIGATMGMIALGGRGAVPASLVALYALGGAVTGHNQDVEENMQWLDHWNVLRALTGIDYSNNFGPDYVTGAQPTLEGFEKAFPDAMREATKSSSLGELAAKAGAATLLEGISLFPKLGPTGYDDWKSMLKDVEAVGEGTKKVYFTVNGALKSVQIDYSYPDAVRDWIIGGVNPKAKEKIDQVRSNTAAQNDSTYASAKNIMPARSTNSDTSSRNFDLLPSRVTN